MNKYIPNERGEWTQSDETHPDIYYCSNCKNEAYWDTDYGQQLFDYCPYCGSRNKIKLKVVKGEKIV